MLIVQGAADFISVTPDINKELFDQYSHKALGEDHLLKNLTGAPDFKMKYVYPLEGNEAVLGINYRNLPGQWEQALRAKETGKMVVAGPLKLVQGGSGLIGRVPVFIHKDGRKKFWGIVSSVIDTERLFDRVGIAKSGLNISIRGRDGKGYDGDVFLGDPQLFAAKDSVQMPVDFPSGKWIISAVPKGGWSALPPLSPIVHSFVLLLMTITGIGVYRTAKRNHTIQTVQQSLNHAQAMAHLGSWRLDYANDLLWWSDETYRIFGLNKDSFNPTLKNFMNMVHPEDRDEVLEMFNSSVEKCGSYSVDHRIIRPDGKVRYVQERGETICVGRGSSPTHSTGTILDITERKQAEEALKASEEKMRAMSEASYDALIVVDANDIISFWSPAAEKMFGWSAEEALGKKMHPLIAPEEYHRPAREGLKHFSKFGDGPLLGSIQEMVAVRRNGEKFPVERSVTSFMLGDSHLAVGSLRDITERKQIEQELRNYADRLRLASEAGGIGVWEWSVLTDNLSWDEQMFRLYSVEPGEFSGLYEAWRNRIHPDDLENAESSLQQAVQSAGVWNFEFRIRLPSGEVRHIKAAALVQVDEQNNPEFVIGVNWDVTEARLQAEQLRLLATRDEMTQLYNRRRFLELVEHEVGRSKRYLTPFSLIMFDADKFKSVNDTYGHDVGDMVLKAIAATAKDALREVDILGRIGGEEFAVGLPETDLEDAVLVAERLREDIGATSVTLKNGISITFTVSLGVALLDESCEDVDVLLKRADLALYAAKENGRNRVERYSVDLDD